MSRAAIHDSHRRAAAGDHNHSPSAAAPLTTSANLDAAQHQEVTVGDWRRTAIVGAAIGADVLINFPLWITAKRMGSGLSPPRSVGDAYKGGGAMWCR